MSIKLRGERGERKNKLISPQICLVFNIYVHDYTPYLRLIRHFKKRLMHSLDDF